jgi:E3 ubiquitin-protein ligase UHRF1
MPTPYERGRADNIKRNREILLSLELDELKKYVPPKDAKKDMGPVAKSRKRKSPPPRDTNGEGESEAKVVKTGAAQDITNTSGVRRSARNTGKMVDYKSEVVKNPPQLISAAAKDANNSEGKSTLERRHNPYVKTLSRRHRIANRVW